MSVYFDKWETLKISDVVDELKSGFSYSKDKLPSQGVLQLRPYNINTHLGLDLSKKVYVPSDYLKLEEYFLKKNDILFNNTNSVELVGKSTIIEDDFEAGYTNHITRIRVDNSKIEPHWLLFCLHYNLLRENFSRVCNRWIGQAGISNTMLKKLEIPVPAIPIQQKIIKYLNNLFKKTDEILKLNKNIEQELESLLPSIREQLIPENNKWKTNSFENIIETTRLGLDRGKSQQSLEKNYFYVKMNNITADGNIDLSKITKVNATEDEVNTYSLKENDFLFNTRNSLELVGKTAIWKNQNAVHLFNNNIMRIRFKKNINPEFINQSFHSAIVSKQLDKFKKATTSVCAIYWKDLKTVQIPIPDHKEQNTITKQINQINDHIQNLMKLHMLREIEIDNLVSSVFQGIFKGKFSN